MMIRNYQANGILLKLIVILLKDKTKIHEKFIYISLKDLIKRIRKLQKKSGFIIYEFYDKKISGNFFRDIGNSLSCFEIIQEEKHLSITETPTKRNKLDLKITISSSGFLSAGVFDLPKILQDNIETFLKGDLEKEKKESECIVCKKFSERIHKVDNYGLWEFLHQHIEDNHMTEVLCDYIKELRKKVNKN